MPPYPLQTVIHHLRRAVTREENGGLTDAQLLDNFVRHRDEAAFELLVWRHGAMVFAACRRLLHDRHEAEDAFQATFLVLVRKAKSIRQGDSVGGWLHRVACRIARRARAQAARRAHQALPGDDLPAREGPDEVLWKDLRPVLDEEVDRLPEKYRRPFVLCCLEGNTNEQAARQLGCPKGTILSRLTRGRERLRARLARRGVALSGGLLSALLIDKACAAAPPAALVGATAWVAVPFAAGSTAADLVSARPAAWTEGVLKAMFLTKLKISAVIALVVALGATGAGLFTQSLLADPRVAAQERGRPEGGRERGDARGAARPEVRGVLKAVDSGKGTITVTLMDRRESPTEQTFTVSKTAEVGLGAGLGRNARGTLREGKLADLAPGAMVALQLAADGKVVEFIMAEGPTVRGILKWVDAGKSTVTLTTTTRPTRRDEPAQEEEKTFAVGPKTEIGVDDGTSRLFSLRQTKLADLPVGAIATVKLSTDLKQVQTLVVEGATAGGTVKAMDADKKQITLTTRAAGRGADAEEKAFDVSPEAEILIDDGKGRRFSVKEANLADVPAGAIAVVRLSADQKMVTSIRAEGAIVHGAVKSVDAGKNTITLVTGRARDGTPVEEKTYEVAKDVRVVIDGKEGKLADVKVNENGPPVGLRLSLDQKAVTGITVGGRDGRR
jgi:RNA polymerase sigma factor (sigma-70 family)